MELEIWKDVIGYEGFYEVSSIGRIKRLATVIDGRNGSYKRKEAICKTQSNRPYHIVGLFKGGATKYVGVHRLVAMAFILNPSKYEEVNHLNGIKSDNTVANLEWCSPKENIHHALQNGLVKTVGISYKMLTPPIIKSIMELKRSGMSRNDIMASTNVTRGALDALSKALRA